MVTARSFFLALVYISALLIGASPALAVYVERLELANMKSSELPGAGVTLTFKTKTGETVPVETRKDDDNAVFVSLPDQSASEGTLVVSRTGKPDTMIAIPAHGSDQTVLVDLGKGTATIKPKTAEPSQPAAAPAPSPNFVAAGGGEDFIDVPSTGFGVIIEPDNEHYALRTKSRINAPSMGGALGFGLGSPGWRAELLVNYANGSSSAHSSVEPGGMNVGIVFSDFSPSDSTGLVLGDNGLNVESRTRAHNFDFMGKALFDWCDDDDDGLYWDGVLGFSYRDAGVRQWAYVDSPTYGSSIYSDTWQSLSENRYGLMFGTTGHYLPDRAGAPGFSFDMFAALELLYHDTSLHSMQENECTVCSGTDYPFDINIHDSSSKFGVGLRGGLGISQQLSDNIRIGVLGELHYVNNAPAIFNPETGDDLYVRNKPTQLTSKSTLDAGVHAYITFSGF